MMISNPRFAFALAATTLLQLAAAKNPEDVVGVISDTVVPDPEICRALCKENSECYSSLYNFECNQCWQMDCVSSLVYTGADDWTKPSADVRYRCPSEGAPVMPDDCGNITATATVTSVDQASETGDSSDEEDSAGTVRAGGIALGVSALGLSLFML